MPVILVRHTRPDVGKGICYGRSDIDVASTFPAEAAEVVASLGKADRLVTSPLQRCRKLADYIAAVTGLAVTADERLQEMDFGRWEGCRWSDVERAELDAWANDFMHARPHGGESVAMLTARTHAVLAEYRAGDERCVLVTHAGVIKAALAKGGSADEFAADTPFGGIVDIQEART